MNLKSEQRLVAVQGPGHSGGGHGESYHLEVQQRLDNKLNEIGQNASQDEAKAALNQVVDGIIEDIKSGKLKLRGNQSVTVIPDEIAAAIRPDRYGYVRKLNAAKAIENDAGRLTIILNVWDVVQAATFLHNHPHITIDPYTGDIHDDDTGN